MKSINKLIYREMKTSQKGHIYVTLVDPVSVDKLTFFCDRNFETNCNIEDKVTATIRIDEFKGRLSVSLVALTKEA